MQALQILRAGLLLGALFLFGINLAGEARAQIASPYLSPVPGTRDDAFGLINPATMAWLKHGSHFSVGFAEETFKETYKYKFSDSPLLQNKYKTKRQYAKLQHLTEGYTFALDYSNSRLSLDEATDVSKTPSVESRNEPYEKASKTRISLASGTLSKAFALGIGYEKGELSPDKKSPILDRQNKESNAKTTLGLSARSDNMYLGFGMVEETLVRKPALIVAGVEDKETRKKIRYNFAAIGLMGKEQKVHIEIGGYNVKKVDFDQAGILNQPKVKNRFVSFELFGQPHYFGFLFTSRTEVENSIFVDANTGKKLDREIDESVLQYGYRPEPTGIMFTLMLSSISGPTTELLVNKQGGGFFPRVVHEESGSTIGMGLAHYY